MEQIQQVEQLQAALAGDLEQLCRRLKRAEEIESRETVRASYIVIGRYSNALLALEDAKVKDMPPALLGEMLEHGQQMHLAIQGMLN